MKQSIKLFTPFAFAVMMLAASCTESKTDSKKEEIEIKSMDSTSKAVKENLNKLEEQTKKVEESLEKLDKEFENSN
jgi:hypothetical protein